MLKSKGNITIDNNKKTALVIIDAQNDFHTGGSLAIPGADEDSKRISDFINTNGKEINGIYVTLDTHLKLHIAHSSYWENSKGEEPAPFTKIKNADIKSGLWMPKNKDKLDYAKFYTQQLEDKGKFVLCIWPYHCLLGTNGNNIYPLLNDSLQNWVSKSQQDINYIQKGMNCNTEMYSAVAADVPDSNDPSTGFNTKFVNDLNTYDIIIVCGQAKSHCLNFTMHDFLKTIDPSKLILLNDCTSPVKGFEKEADLFEQDMKTAGCTVCNVSDILFLT